MPLTVMMKDGKILLTPSGKLATDCEGEPCETQSVALWGSEPYGNDGVFTGSVTFEREADNFVFDGGLDDICVVSPSSVTVSGTSVSAASGFVIMPNSGDINGRCCNWDPRTFTISVGGATYTKSCTGDESYVPFEDFRSGCEGAGITVKDMPCVLTRAEMESLGYGMPPTIHFGHVHCDVGSAGISVYTCYRVKYTCQFNCQAREWGDPQRGTHTEDPVSGWTWDAATWRRAVCVIEPEIEDGEIVWPEVEKPGFTPDCYYHWYANYNCATGAWVLTKNGTWNFVPYGGWPSAWSEEECVDGACHRYVLNDPAQPSPPSYAMQCYWRWGAYPNCYGEEPGWTVQQEEVWASGTDETQAWTGSSSYYYCVTDTDEEPDPPEGAPPCVWYWDANWNGSSWDIYQTWADVGSPFAWQCFDTYCYCATETSDRPSAPPDPE